MKAITFSVAVSTDWCFYHRNKKTLKAIGDNVFGVYQDAKNNLQHFLYRTTKERDEAYERFSAIGANPIKIKTPAFVDEKETGGKPNGSAPQPCRGRTYNHTSGEKPY